MLPSQDADHDVLMQLADTLPGLVGYVDRDRHYRFLNARHRDWLGIDPASYIGRSTAEFAGALTPAGLAACLTRALAGESLTFDTTGPAGSGLPARLRCQLLPRKAEDGSVLGSFILTTDVTAEWRAEEDLRAARDEALSGSRTMSALLAAASHDLRQPLHALTLFARALSRRVEAGEPAALVGHMEAALDSLREMINALLDMSKLDAGLIEPHQETVSLRDLLQPLEAGFAATAREQGLTFRLRALDLAVRTDPALLETVLRNLIANALKFTERGGVLVGCRRRGRILRLEVYDTGPGIPEDRLQHVFNAFERAPSQARGANEGLGLGLAIVRRLAGLLGIEVGARSVVGRGSCFTLDLPLLEPSPCVDRAAAVPADQAQALNGRRILVLEEDPTLRDALAEELLGHGAAVVAATAKDLMTRLPELGAVDAAVFDQSLSDNRAAALLSRLNRHLGAVVPAVMLTGATDSSILASIEQAGWHWLSKPVDLAALLTALQTLC